MHVYVIRDIRAEHAKLIHAADLCAGMEGQKVKQEQHVVAYVKLDTLVHFVKLHHACQVHALMEVHVQYQSADSSHAVVLQECLEHAVTEHPVIIDHAPMVLVFSMV